MSEEEKKQEQPENKDQNEEEEEEEKSEEENKEEEPIKASLSQATLKKKLNIILKTPFSNKKKDV